MYFVIEYYFPKSVGRYPLFVILVLADLYLYSAYHQKIWSWKRLNAILAVFIYWTPILSVAFILIGSMIYPFEYWGKAFRNYLTGFILIGYLSKMVPIFFLIVADLTRFYKWIGRRSTKQSCSGGIEKSNPISRSAFLKKIGLISGGLMFSGLFVGMIKWVYDFKVRREIVNIPDLPKSFAGLQIAQISDLHLGSWIWKNEMENAVEIINNQNPDLIFFTGDLVNYTTDEVFEFEESFKKLKAKYGIFCVLGNHDYGDYKRWESKQAKNQNMVELYSFFSRIGWKLLRNENRVIQKGNEKIAIIGVENWGSLGRFQKYGDLDKAIKGVENIPVKILLSHDPSHWELKVNNCPVTIDLTFAGHTHGAQFGVEIPGIRWSPAQYIYKYWAGLYSEINTITGKKQYLYVNRGLGAIGYPGRVGILPEITLVELQS